MKVSTLVSWLARSVWLDRVPMYDCSVASLITARGYQRQWSANRQRTYVNPYRPDDRKVVSPPNPRAQARPGAELGTRHVAEIQPVLWHEVAAFGFEHGSTLRQLAHGLHTRGLVAGGRGHHAHEELAKKEAPGLEIRLPEVLEQQQPHPLKAWWRIVNTRSGLAAHLGA